MGNKKTGITPFKLLILAAAAVGIVLSTEAYQQVTNSSESTNEAVVPYPVDRSELSHSILPSETPFFETQHMIGDELDVDLQKTSDQPAGPSSYELKLADQRAWGSQHRPVGFASNKKAASNSPVTTEMASNDQPIVPGIEDPHRWYELPTEEIEVAIQPKQETAAKETADIEDVASTENNEPAKKVAPIAIAKVPTLPSPSSVLTNPAKTLPPQKIAPPAVRTARAWETGRY